MRPCWNTAEPISVYSKWRYRTHNTQLVSHASFDMPHIIIHNIEIASKSRATALTCTLVRFGWCWMDTNHYFGFFGNGLLSSFLLSFIDREWLIVVLTISFFPSVEKYSRWVDDFCGNTVIILILLLLFFTPHVLFFTGCRKPSNL